MQGEIDAMRNQKTLSRAALDEVRHVRKCGRKCEGEV